MAGNLILPSGLGELWRRYIYARPVARAAVLPGDRAPPAQPRDRSDPGRDAPINGQRLTARAEARQRLSVLLLLFLAVPIVLGLRLTDLAVFEAQPVVTRAVASAAPPRADITDRDGVELARTFEAYAISVEPRKLAGNPAVLARRIAAIHTPSVPDPRRSASYTPRRGD